MSAKSHEYQYRPLGDRAEQEESEEVGTGCGCLLWIILLVQLVLLALVVWIVGYLVEGDWGEVWRTLGGGDEAPRE